MIIYKITNTVNDKVYIGQTIRTLNERKSEYKRMKFYNFHLENAFKKYGFDNFKFEVIDSGVSIDELNRKEIFWIKDYDSINKKIGYNIMEGGRNSKLSNETKQKMSIVRKGKKQSKQWIENRIAKSGTEEAKKYGKQKTEEQRKLISKNHAKYWKGKERDDETKAKISKSKKGQLPSNVKPVHKIYKSKTLFTILDSYLSTSEAARKNRSYSQSKISRICNKKTDTKPEELFTFIFASGS